MAQQSRAKITRQAILAAAVDVIDEVGYSNASLTEVIDRAGVTKGAFHYHFPTKLALAEAIVKDSNSLLEDAVRAVLDSSSSGAALETLVRAAFAVADRAHFEKTVRIGIQLTDALGNEADGGSFERQRDFLVDAVEQAISEGDVRTDVNAKDLGHTLWVSLLGNRLLSESAGEDLIDNQARVLRIILAGACTEQSIDFFAHFVDRVAHQFAASMSEQRA